MPEMKNSFLKIKSTFIETELGKVSLELNTSRSKVLAINKQGIQSSIPLDAVATSEDRWVKACREFNEDKFNQFVKEISEV